MKPSSGVRITGDVLFTVSHFVLNVSEDDLYIIIYDIVIYDITVMSHCLTDTEKNSNIQRVSNASRTYGVGNT